MPIKFTFVRGVSITAIWKTGSCRWDIYVAQSAPIEFRESYHFRKAASRPWYLKIWTQGLRCHGVMSSLIPLAIDPSLLVLLVKLMRRKNSQGKEANSTTMLINNTKV